MIKQEIIDRIISDVDILEVAKDGGITIAKSSRTRHWACCPFHKESGPSFYVDTATNTWRCFGCHSGGNVISLYRKLENDLPFPIACRNLAKKYLNEDIEDDYKPSNEEIEKQKEADALRIVLSYAQSYFQDCIRESNAGAQKAREAVKARWGEDAIDTFGIGYAPKEGFLAWAKTKGLDFDNLEAVGLVGEGERGKYAMLRDRYTIPIYDKMSRVIGFTARTMSDNKDICKYLNLKNSLVYHKDTSVFGINFAQKEARLQDKFYLVEGGPDVVKLQSIGILNTVASLGGAWTPNQLKQLFKLARKVTFIPDADTLKPGNKWPAGTVNVFENGRAALQAGFTVNVREIPVDYPAPKKEDPDSWIVDRGKFSQMRQEEFIFWYCKRKYWPTPEDIEEFTTEARLAAIGDICSLLMLIRDEDTQSSYLSSLCSIYKHNREWKDALKRSKTAAAAEKQEKERKGDLRMLHEFGFVEHDNSYFGTNKDGDEIQWSNFELKPLFHIRDDFNPVRLFEIKNNNPETAPRLIELNMEEITSSSSLRKRLFGMGDYIWMAKDEQLIKLLGYLGRVTETADPIKQLGWQREGFYAFCNGAIEQGSWMPIDDMGILRLTAGKFYLPAMSKLNIDSRELYVNEKKFRHEKMMDHPTSQADFFAKVVQVFGENAMVGLCFYIATLFRDIVITKSRSFPLLNAFGPKGCGKTEFAATLMNFFYKYETKYEPLSINSASLPALSDYVGSVNDALVHIDEYQNAIDNRKVQWLKDLWNGVGRAKMNMDKDKKLVQAKVDSGIILTGQEMPTADIALFTRIIYLTFDKGEHTREEKQHFAELERFRQIGATHITIELLRHREQFQAAFGMAWKKAVEDLETALEDDNILDRIMTNWTVLLASYLAIKDYAKLPFTYEELLKVVVADVKRQNSMCNSTDEVAGFWNIINAAVQMGELRKDQDFKIKLVGSLTTNKAKIDNWSQPKSILMVRKDITMAIYRKLGRSMDVNLLPKESLLHYLQIGPEFYGTAKNAERFKKFAPNGLPETVEKLDENGNMVGRQTLWYKDRPLCFDYQMVAERYGIDFETETGDEEKPQKDPYQMSDRELEEAGVPTLGF